VALASLVELFKYIGAIAHKACGLPDRLALIGLLSKLTLIGSDTGYACLLQHFGDTILIPRCGIGQVFMQEQSTLGYLLAIQLAHPRKMNAPRLLLRLDNLGSRFLLLMYCQVLNAVHMGVPTSNVGFCSSSSFSAFNLMLGLEKSHGSPFSSGTVRSKANPNAMP
jgi:hypothetical protein